ncbi:Soluble guanylate cyclase gcy-37 [Labeo rohita]|uniref:Soluble guanylate cyclase gcy-37 n=1 Tax=Labeo rohita TaxID=84645 RepID=A0ABQ8L684_LABRO|nr:Soluble guanylate cyclase gcy-37 [Labeo rohita]
MEQEVLPLFKKEGENLLKNMKQARKILKEAEREAKEKGEVFADPPPYGASQGQFPILKGVVGVTGEMQMEGDVELRDEERMGPDDLEGLVTRLPDVHEEAGKWIRVFEEETMGKLLAVGDIKALLAKIIGGSKDGRNFSIIWLRESCELPLKNATISPQSCCCSILTGDS